MASENRVDPEGYEISLEDERWQHILERHPEMEEFRDLLLMTIAQPQAILRDRDREEVFYYYRLTGRTVWRHNDIYVSAVVERWKDNKGRVKTAYLVKHTRKDGILIWFSPQKK